MIRHYLKLIWNRKRSNVLIAVEIFLSFLVVFVVATLGIFYADGWNRPRGYSIDNVWHVQLEMRAGSVELEDKIPPEIIETFRQLIASVRELPQVEAVAAASCPPYGNSEWISGSDFGAWHLRYGVSLVTDDLPRVLRTDLTRGRWFGREDDGASWIPVVVNEAMATEIFHDKNPIGNAVPQEKNRDGTVEREMRVVGVVHDFRQHGEAAPMNGPQNYLLQRYQMGDLERRPPQSLLIRVRPGTTAQFEETLVKQMQAAARDWSFEVDPVDDMREKALNATLAPLLGAAIIAGFLMLMVAMGLTGVVWQTVTQRTREIGLRRAKGATITDIRKQVIGELIVLASVALVAGAVIVLQFPLLKLMNFVSGRQYVESLVVSAACIYLLTIAAAWYPSRLATRIQPAEALHYE